MSICSPLSTVGQVISNDKPKMVKVAVNGFGRIGRLVFRYAWDDPTLEIVHVNDLCSIESAAYLVKYDSVHGTWDKDVVQEENDHFTVDGQLVTFSQKKNYTEIDFQKMGVEMVLECTGVFLKTDNLQPYLSQCGVKRVVVSAPVKEDGVHNIVLGCNHALLDQKTQIVTNASCTTNCLAPVVKTIKEKFGIKHGCITTIHDVTGTQVRFISFIVNILYIITACEMLTLYSYLLTHTFFSLFCVFHFNTPIGFLLLI